MDDDTLSQASTRTGLRMRGLLVGEFSPEVAKKNGLCSSNCQLRSALPFYESFRARFLAASNTSSVYLVCRTIQRHLQQQLPGAPSSALTAHRRLRQSDQNKILTHSYTFSF